MYESKLWYLVTIADTEGLPGKSFLHLLNIILNEKKFNYTVLNDIDGAGVYNLLQVQNTIISIETLLNLLIEVKQFDWATIFLFFEYPQNWNDRGEPYPELIRQTNTTIRAIDDSYIDIITPYEDLVDILKYNYKIKNIEYGDLNSFTYPE